MRPNICEQKSRQGEVPTTSIERRSLWLLSSSILIATPSYDGFLTIECVSSVLRLMESMKKTEPNVTFRWRQVAGALVDHARNLSTVVTHTCFSLTPIWGFHLR